MSDNTGADGGLFEEVIIHGDGTETVYDPLVGIYTQSTSPFSANPTLPYEVDMKIQVGVTSRVRDDAHQWRMTKTYTSTFYLDTTTQNFRNAIPALCNDIWTFAQSEITNGAIVGFHGSVWLDNFTHPPTGAGIVRLPKGHRDVAYTQKELESVDWLEGRLNNICQDLKNTARY